MDFITTGPENNKSNACAWVEVDLDAVSENLDTVRSLVGRDTKVCSVVKADAYGHGVIDIARHLEEQGVDYLAVAVLDEAIELRQIGVETPILILGPIMPDQAAYVMRYNLTQTICSFEMAEELSHEAARFRKKAKVHVKVDTGMGRIGMYFEDAVAEISKIRDLPNVEIEGIFTHFATSDYEEKSFVYEQWENFNQVLSDLKDQGINIPIAHCATSATIIDLPFMKLDMVRPGLMLYGLYPRANMREKVDLKPALKLKARISYLKDINKRRSISYSRKYFAEPGERIATLPLGYYDGYRRILSNKGEVLVRGKRCPVVGRVCMDHVMIRVSDLDEVRRYDEVVIIGRQGDEEIAVDEVAGKIFGINYEVVACLGKRLPRIYYRDGGVSSVRNLMGYHSAEVTCRPVETPLGRGRDRRRSKLRSIKESRKSGVDTVELQV